MTTHNQCPFCRENNMLTVPVIAETDGAFLIEAVNHPGNFLIIPTIHAETLGELPDNWWRSLKELLAKVPVPLGDYNISVNIGRHAGQTLGHVHFWVVPRAGGTPSAGKGLLTLVQNADDR